MPWGNQTCVSQLLSLYSKTRTATTEPEHPRACAEQGQLLQ